MLHNPTYLPPNALIYSPSEMHTNAGSICRRGNGRWAGNVKIEAFCQDNSPCHTKISHPPPFPSNKNSLIECGCGIYYVHDEFDFFPEECCVSADGEPFDNLCEDPFDNISDAIKLWVSLTGISQDDRTEEEMVEFVNGYDYGVD